MTVGGDIYSVFDSGIPGVGILYRVSSRHMSGTKQYHPVVEGGPLTSMWGRGPYSVSYTAGLEMMFVKTDYITPGRYTVTGNVVAKGAHAEDYKTPALFDIAVRDFALEVIDNPGCKLATHTVNMGFVTPAMFVGGVAPTRDYTIGLDCDKAVGNVDYSFNPLTSALDAATSTYALNDAGSADTAKGVGIQYLDAAGVPLRTYRYARFGVSSAIGRISKQFQVRYRQIGPDSPTPGNADASVQVLVAFP